MEDEGDAEGDEDADGDDMDAEGDNDEDQDQDVEQDADQDNDQDDNDNDDDEDQEDNDNENDNDQDNDQDNENNNDNENESPSQSRRQSRASPTIRRGASAPKVTLTSPSPRPSSRHSPSAMSAFWPSTPPEALAASTYDIVPTMAAPQNTSINSMATTPDMRWVFSGGADGYIRMYNWVETANGKVPLTVAQKHPFVDSVMKAGSLTTYWENEESSVRTPPAQSADEPKDLSPVYSLAAHHQAVWLLSGLESGGINLQTCRHQAGTRITTLREHTSAVSVLDLAHDELSFLSGSWDKTIHDWDLNVGKVKRTFRGSGGQISAIERRPESSIPVPTITEDQAISSSSTFSSNNADKPATNGVASLPNGTNPPRRGSRNTENGTEDAAASPDGSLFGDDSGSLFGDNDDAANGGSRSNNFDDDDEFSKAIANDIHQQNEDDANANVNVDADADTDTDMDAQATALKQEKDVDMTDAGTSADQLQQSTSTTGSAQPIASDPEAAITASKDVSATTNGVSHAENASTTAPSAVTASIDASLPPAQTSSTTFLDAAIDGTIRIWDRRMPDPIARLLPPRGTPPWCMAACWSPDGNTIYAGSTLR